MTSALIERVLPSYDNPRRAVADISDIVQTIESVGLIEPIVVTAEQANYRVISGHRRLAAAQKAGLREVPIRVIEIEDGIPRITAMLVANTCRADLDPIDEARAYKRLIDAHDLTQRKLARIVGKSQGHIAKRLSLLALPEREQLAVQAREIPVTHAQSRSHHRSFRTLPDELVPIIDAASVLRRLGLRDGQGLFLRPAECDVVESLIKQAVAALRDVA